MREYERKFIARKTIARHEQQGGERKNEDWEKETL